MMSTRASKIGVIVAKVVICLACLYFFICSLSFLSTACRLMTGKQSGKLFSSSALLQNPILGMMLGVVTTALIASSSTTTSVIVGMVGADVLKVQQAIPMIMGANIGTSITNTLVGLAKVNDRPAFARAFSCGVVHDMFNWLTVTVLLIVEVLTGFLYTVTGLMVSGLDTDKAAGQKPPDMLKAITKPFTKLIVQIDKKVLTGWSLNDTKYENVTSLLAAKCRRPVGIDLSAALNTLKNESDQSYEDAVEYDKYECGYLLANWGLDDVWVGLMLFIISLLMLGFSLFGLMKLLNSMMDKQMSGIIKKTLNAELPYAPWLTGYIAIIVGMIITFIIQSSNVFTVTLTPLAWSGLLELHRAYPLTLGSNLGTTLTGLMAALAADGEKLRDSLQIALCHTTLNLCGILMFYPLPFTRIPLPLASWMGETVAQYRWFAIVYLVVMFLIVPSYVFCLSLLGPVAIYVGVVPILVLLVVTGLITAVQQTRPRWLPVGMRTWAFLPTWMHSLEPYDKLIAKVACCCKHWGIGEGRDGPDVDEIDIHGRPEKREKAEKSQMA